VVWSDVAVDGGMAGSVSAGGGVAASGGVAALRSFGQVAQTVALIGRFRSRCAQRRYIAFGQCFVEPIVRQSAHCGNKYWSILEEENSQFLDQLGYYGKGRGSMLKAETGPPAPNGVPGRRRSGWASLKVAAINKTPAAVPPNVARTADGESSPPTLQVLVPLPLAEVARKSPVSMSSRPTDGRKFSVSRLPRLSDAGLIQDGGGDNAENDYDDSLPEIPSRFTARPSVCFSAQQPLFVPRPEPVSGPPVRIPTIEINDPTTTEINNNNNKASRTLI